MKIPPDSDSNIITDISADEPKNKSRRLLLKLMGLGAGVSANKIVLAGGKDLANDLISVSDVFNDVVNITLYRPGDLLELQLSFIGFQKSTDNKSLTKTSSPNLLYVGMQPQSIAEQAYEEKGGKDGANFDAAATSAVGEIPPLNPAEPTLPAKTYLSGKTRLIFQIPATITSIPLTAKDLLNWDKYQLVVNNRAATATIPPRFSPRDNVSEYNNILIDGKNLHVNPTGTDPVIKPHEEPKPVNNNREQRPVIQPTDRRQQPVRIIQPNRDTSRQVQVNRELRGATKDEQKAIEVRERPKEITRQQNNNTGIVAVIQDLRIGKTPRPIDNDETSIEMPYRLFISPNQYAAWYHEYKLKLREDLKGAAVQTYELWHSRLTCKNCDNEKDLTDATKSLRTVRALWGVDIKGKWNEKPGRDSSFKTSLYNDDRHCIVHESSNWALPGNFIPKPVQVHNLMLSTLGAWFDAEMLVKRKELQDAGIIGSLNLLKWKHIATLARDHYVEVVYAGNIMPFGHEASLVRVTERKPQNGYAVNRQRYFIVITEEEKKYNPYNPNNGNFKSFPFSTIKFITTATPTIDPPKAFCSDLAEQADHQFIPRSANKDFLFKIIAYDLEGNEVGFEMPVVFVSTDVTYNDSGTYDLASIGKLNACYNSKKLIANKIGLRNQKMALTRSSTPGDTMFEVQSVTFNSHGTIDEAPGFRPECTEFEIFISAVENLTGNRQSQRVKLVDDEINKPEAQRKNKGKVFAALIDVSKVDFNGSGNKTGGSLSPNFSITALSKSLGAVGGAVNDLQNMNFNPDQFFDTNAKLFGVIPLGKIIQAVEGAAAVVSGSSVQSPIPALKNIETNDAHITQYIWNGAKMAKYNTSFFDFVPEGGSGLRIETNLYRYKNASKPISLTVNSTLDAFAIHILNITSVNFKKVGFLTGSNAKVDFSIEMGKPALSFLGPLTFINELQKYIPADGFSDPPFLDVTTAGVKTGFTLGLPNIQLGAFTLSHITLGATVNLPFTGEPLSLRFNFCEKQQPFTLTVSALGGGGFFAIEFDMNGLRSMEAALEFGAAVSINLGVASGAVSIMAGIYFKVTNEVSGKTYHIEGYVRINGSVSVLGLITASIEFLLLLAAEIGKVSGKDKVTRVWGEATLKIKVEVFMFSKTVTLKTSKQFAGAGADPTFGMMISNGDWADYCDSFAA